MNARLVGTNRDGQRSKETMGGMAWNVLSDVDLVGVVLSHADLDATSFVRVGRVCKAWRCASRDANGAILMAAARKQRFLTKTAFAGLFGLSSNEANSFPREVVYRPCVSCGLMYKYKRDAVDLALDAIGGVVEWERRLAKRARYEMVESRDVDRVSKERPRAAAKVCG